VNGDLWIGNRRTFVKNGALVKHKLSRMSATPRIGIFITCVPPRLRTRCPLLCAVHELYRTGPVQEAKMLKTFQKGNIHCRFDMSVHIDDFHHVIVTLSLVVTCTRLFASMAFYPAYYRLGMWMYSFICLSRLYVKRRCRACKCVFVPCSFLALSALRVEVFVCDDEESIS
jgi:hypothetical protein